MHYKLQNALLGILFIFLSTTAFADIGNPGVTTVEDDNVPINTSDATSQQPIPNTSESEAPPAQIPPANAPNSDTQGADFITYDPNNTKEKPDPFPLEKYTGQFLTDIKAIQKAYQANQTEIVKASLDKMYQTNPQTMEVEGYLILAAIYDKLQSYAHAIDILNTGKSTIPDGDDKKTVFELNQAQILRHAGKPKDSIEVLDQIHITQVKKHPEIFFYKGLCYLYLKDVDSAVVNLRKYLDLLPQNTQNSNIRRAIAWLILQRGGKVNHDNSSNSVTQEQNTEKMLQLLIDKQISSDVGGLIQSTNSNVQNKDLDLPSQEIQDLENYSNIVE